MYHIIIEEEFNKGDLKTTSEHLQTIKSDSRS